MHLVEATAMKATMATRHEPGAADEAPLRQALREAIEIHKAAAARVKLTTAAQGRASAALTTAQAEVDRLEAQQKRTSDTAVEKASKMAADALRAGSPVPIVTTIPDSMVTASLASAERQKAVLAAAHAELNAETATAKSELARATEAVAAAADAIIGFEARRLVAKRITLEEMCRDMDDCIHGMLRFDRQRRDGPRLEKLEFELAKKIDRRTLAVAQDKRLIEQPSYMDHIAKLQAAQEGRWAAFRAALMNDASAQFEAHGGHMEQ